MDNEKDNEQIGLFDEQHIEVTKSSKPRKSKKVEEDIVNQPLGTIIDKTVEEVMQSSMLPYSEYVILDRALPRVEDGLKPVQRRILYTMLELGVTPDKPYKKSARIVGDCLGKYHPHGDTSVYDATVRLAQDFNMGSILVQGHGNFGSIDGDSAAAMRYTEVKLAPLALELMRDLDKDTVTYSLNFDDTLKEPDYFTGRFPNLLVNGASGIAVGLATNIPPHNLNEVIDAVVEYIENKNCQLEDLLKHIKGPDFPTGGIIAKSEEMVEAYKTGRGRVVMRATYHLEEQSNGKIDIVITELPFQVNKADFLQKVLVAKEKVKGELNNISDIQDESDKAGMRAVITLKKGSNPTKAVALLYKNTDMEKAFNYNVVAIANGKPRQMGLMEIMKYYVDFQVDVICRRTKFDLDKAQARAHIVRGLVVAIQNIDEVIKIIKGSASTMQAKDSLMTRFALTELQANAILDMRLSRLTNLETVKLEEELVELEKLIKELEKILASKARQLFVVEKEILDIKKRFNVARRTKVVNSFAKYTIEEEVAPVETKECVVAVSVDGLRLKNIALNSVADVDNSFKNYDSLNVLHNDSLKTNTAGTVLAFTDHGNVCKFKVSDIPECKFNAKGILLSQILKSEMEEKIVNIYEYEEMNENGELIFFTKFGFIKKSQMSEYRLTKFVANAIKLKEDDKVMTVQYNYNCPTAVFVTNSGMVLNCELADVPVQKRMGSGVIGISLYDKDYVKFVSQVNLQDKMLIVSDCSNAKRVNLVDFGTSSRNRKGLRVLPNGQTVAFAVAPIVSGELVLQNIKDEIITVDVNKIDVMDRISTGKAIIGDNTSNKVKLGALYLN